MELGDYVAVLKKRWVTVCAVTVLSFLGACFVTLTTTPMYVASSQLYVSVQGGSTTSDMLQGAGFARQQVTSYARLVTSPLVLGPVIDDLALPTNAGALGSRIVAESPQNSSLINISVADESPALAAALANSVAEEFRRVVVEIERPTDGSPSAVRLTVVRDASAPSAPSSPRPTLNLTLGLTVGLMLGGVLAFLRVALDSRLHDEASVADVTGLPIVGSIVFDEHAAAQPLIVQADPQGPRAEAFRRLRTNVQFLDVAERPKSMVVTSSLPGEGKSTTTINLAIAMADAGTRVALVDADLRRPSVARYLGIEGSAGLTTVLIGRATVDEVLQPWGNGLLNVLPSGQMPPNPSELLGSAAMGAVLERLLVTHDVVLIDAPPILPVTDAAVLSRSAGGVLVVAAVGRVQRKQLVATLSALRSVDANVLGAIVNMESRKRAESYQYYRYTDGPATTRRSVMPRRSSRTVPARPPAESSRDASVVGQTPVGMVWPKDESLTTRSGGRPAAPQHHRERG